MTGPAQSTMRGVGAKSGLNGSLGAFGDATPGLADDSLHRRFAVVADRLLPAAAGLPGASEVHVAGYFEQLSARPELARVEGELRQGLDLMDALADQLFGVPLVETDAEQCDAVLHRFEALPLPSARKCLRLLVQLAVAGYLCHPMHGGNRDGAAWKALGLSLERQPPVERQPLLEHESTGQELDHG